MDCEHPGEYMGLGLLEASSGAIHVVEWCFNCESRTSTRFVGARELARTGVRREDLPVVKSNRTEDYPCAVCGETRTELHHWAPEHLEDQFEDQAAWPCSYLCREHHLEWHRIVTPGMSRPRGEP